MRKLKSKFVLSLLGLGLIFTSCSNEDTAELTEQQPQAAISQDVLDKISGHVLNANFVERTSFELPNGETQEGFMIEGDIFMSETQVEGLDDVRENDITTEQYRTNNLVSQPRTLTVTGWTGGGGFALTQNMRTGLQFAINNYNRLNLNINFVLSFNTNIDADIVVFRQPNNSGAGGSAGFPSGGDPNRFVQIFTGLDNADPNVNEHVTGHEIGHSIGFRHTDFFSRQSCGQNVNEGDGGVGAVHIPGTPTGFDPTSIMLACFSFGTDGEFNANDITAMEFLY
ncbi:peptidase [Flavobacteriaceae bacterium R38]|nr:peptidase [Flavobacteriaceae bacterium R38]